MGARYWVGACSLLTLASCASIGEPPGQINAGDGFTQDNAPISADDSMGLSGEDDPVQTGDDGDLVTPEADAGGPSEVDAGGDGQGEGGEGTDPGGAADAGTGPVDPPVDVPGGPGDGTCSAPFNVNERLANNTATFNNDTTGASESLSADDSCVGAVPILFPAVPGPDHVYALTMPFRGRVEFSVSALAPFVPALYVLDDCFNYSTLRTCSTGGIDAQALGVLEAGRRIYLYVDSGAIDPLPASGSYTLTATVRRSAEQGEACGSGADEAACEGATVCRAGTCQPVVCGDGMRELDEECDDGGQEDGDGCSSTCSAEYCPGATVLTLTGDTVTVSGDTSGADDDAPSRCADGAADDIYAVYLDSPRDLQVTVAPSGWDPILHLYRDGCGGGSNVGSCIDGGGSGVSESHSSTDAPAGWYTIAVDGYNGQSGPYDLTVTLQ